MEPTYNNYQTPNPVAARLKLYAIVAVIVVVLIVVAVEVLAYLSNGTLIVDTNDSSNVVSLIATSSPGNEAAKPNSKVDPKITYHGGQKIRLKPGNYIVNVRRGDVAAAKTIAVTARQTTQLTLNLTSSVPALEPVGDVNTAQFAAGKSQIIYLDNRYSQLYRIDSSNALSQTSDLNLSTAQWADDSFGVGQDAAGTFYIINNGRLSPLNNLPAIGNGDQSTYAVAPNHDIYLSFGKDVYAGSSAGFKHIFSAGSADLKLAATNDRVAIIEASGQESEPSTVTMVSKDGTILNRAKAEGSLTWSTGGKYLFSISEGPSQIYDSSLRPVATVPNVLPLSIAWQDDNRLFYAQGYQLWQYDVSTGIARIVAIASQGQTPVTTEVDSTGSYVYVAAETSGGSGNYYSLYRYGLKNQSASDAATQLHEHLPWLTDGCFLSLVNFTRPTVSAVSGNKYNDCIATAKDFVQQQNLNPARFAYELSSVLPSTPSN